MCRDEYIDEIISKLNLPALRLQIQHIKREDYPNIDPESYGAGVILSSELLITPRTGGMSLSDMLGTVSMLVHSVPPYQCQFGEVADRYVTLPQIRYQREIPKAFELAQSPTRRLVLPKELFPQARAQSKSKRAAPQRKPHIRNSGASYFSSRYTG